MIIFHGRDRAVSQSEVHRHSTMSANVAETVLGGGTMADDFEDLKELSRARDEKLAEQRIQAVAKDAENTRLLAECVSVLNGTALDELNRTCDFLIEDGHRASDSSALTAQLSPLSSSPSLTTCHQPQSEKVFLFAAGALFRHIDSSRTRNRAASAEDKAGRASHATRFVVILVPWTTSSYSSRARHHGAHPVAGELGWNECRKGVRGDGIKGVAAVAIGGETRPRHPVEFTSTHDQLPAVFRDPELLHLSGGDRKEARWSASRRCVRRNRVQLGVE